MNCFTKVNHKENSTHILIDFDLIVEKLAVGRGDVVLNAGCGASYMSMLLAQKVENEGTVFVMVKSSAAVRALNAKSLSPNILAFQGDITGDTGLASNSIELVYMSCGYHILDPEDRVKLLAEFRRILKPGGRLAIVEMTNEVMPFGSSSSARLSPEELCSEVNMTPVELVSVGEFFYMQIFYESL